MYGHIPITNMKPTKRVKKVNKGDSVVVFYPGFGSVEMKDCEVKGKFVRGLVWNTGAVGSGNMPEDYRGEWEMMNFPLTSVTKVYPITQPRKE